MIFTKSFGSFQPEFDNTSTSYYFYEKTIFCVSCMSVLKFLKTQFRVGRKQPLLCMIIEFLGGLKVIMY